MLSPPRFRRFLFSINRGLIVAWAVVLLMAVCRYAVDLPFQDEWGLFLPTSLPHGTVGGWIFGFDNEHRILVARLVAAISYALGSLDFIPLIILSFCGYLALVFSVWKAVGFAGNGERPELAWTPALLLPLLSTLSLENFTRYDQITVHACLMAWVFGTQLLLKARALTPRRTVAIFLWFVFSMFSFSAGLITCWVSYLFAVTLFSRIRERNYREKILFGLLGAALVASSLVWLVGRPPYKPEDIPHTFPWHASFWTHFLELVSLGFGFAWPHHLLAASLALLSVPAVLGTGLYWVYRKPRDSQRPYVACCLLLGFLAICLTVSFARAANGLDQAKSSRYLEFVGFIPLLVAGILAAFPRIKMGKYQFRPSLLVILLILTVSLKVIKGGRLELTPFRDYHAQRSEQRACVRNILQRQRPYSSLACPNLFGLGTPPLEWIEAAQKLDVHFTRAE